MCTGSCFDPTQRLITGDDSIRRRFARVEEVNKLTARRRWPGTTAARGGVAAHGARGDSMRALPQRRSSPRGPARAAGPAVRLRHGRPARLLHGARAPILDSVVEPRDMSG